MKSIVRRTVLCSIVALLAAAVLGGFGQQAFAGFPDRDISYIIPTSPGGGFDTASRIFVPYFEKYLPNHPNVIIVNAPGGEWTIGIGKIARAKPDGYTVGIMNIPGNLVTQVIGRSRYDLRDFVWLGNLAEVTYVACVSPKSKYKTLEEMRAAPKINVGVVGLASMAGLGSVIALDELGVKMNAIPHDGSTEAILSAMRGDVDFVQYPMTTLKKSIVDSHDLIPVWVYAKKRLKLLPNVPTIAELGYPNLVKSVTMYRPVAATPGTPPEVAKILRDAFWKASNDPEFIQKMEKINATPSPMTGDEVHDLIVRSVPMVAKYKDLLKAARK